MIHNFVCLCPFHLGKDALNFSSILKHIYVRSNLPYRSFKLVYSWDTANCWAHKLLTKPRTSSSGDELITATSCSLHKQRLKLFSCTLMQPPKTSPSCAGPKCALRNSVRTSEGLGMTESRHRNERKGWMRVLVCTVQTSMEKGGQGLVFSLSRFPTADRAAIRPFPK